MCPRTRTRAPRAIAKSKVAKLWILLIGVDRYQDEIHFPSLKYSALDCQGLGEALREATASLAAKEVIVHHDFAARLPDRASVVKSFKQIVSSASAEDTILVYFSGHGILETTTQQVVLCLADTQKDHLLETGLVLNELLGELENSAARQQLVWLDACHSGGMTLRRTEGTLQDPSQKLVEVLRRKAARSRGFYALLSCDRAQQSWEFPELGHGVFTYYLMRGLRGEAADSEGVIEADALYQYVYHQTLRYIDKTNQQIRLINQQKSSRGENRLQSEFPLQTPKRIVEGFGKVVLGKKTRLAQKIKSRQAVVVDGCQDNRTTLALSKLLQGKGGFVLNYFPQAEWKWSALSKAIATALDVDPQGSVSQTTTALLYLKGKIITNQGEARLVFKNGVSLSRSWLRQILKNSQAVHQIVILDCPGGNELQKWIEELRLDTDRGQCLIAANAPETESEKFTQILLNTLETADTQAGFPVAAWITQLQIALANTNIVPQVWLSGKRGVIEVLPAKTTVDEDSGVYDLNLCPYMGLEAFNEDNAQYFYGREELVQRLINRIGRESSMVVVGASGSGKSSVVRAGLLAQLRQGKHIPQSDRWWLGCLRPGSKPLQALAKKLVDPGSKKVRAQQQLQIEGFLYQGVEGFVRWLRSRPEPVVLLAIDQFEELFTLADIVARQQFLELMLGALEHAGDRFKLVFTIRADFVASCLEIPELARIVQQNNILVPPYLTAADYRSAIVKPAEQVGLKVEPGLVEVLLQDLDRSAGSLPLLQFALQQLWERRQGGKLTLDVYRQLGGIKGALERQAQAIYESLEPQARECARWIFLSLTKLGDGTEDTRRRVTKSELIVDKYPAALVEKTLQKLTGAKLLVIDLDSGSIGRGRSAATPPEDDELFLAAMQQEATVEVVHEILIHHWSTLRWWLEENRSRLRSQRQIERAATLWQQQGKQPDFLLQGVRLAEAEEVYIKYTDELSPIAQEFVAACIDARTAAQREAKRRLRRTQLTAATLGVLGLVATTLGITAYRQKTIAQLENVAALNTSSEALLLSNQDLESLLTSVKAGKQLQQIGGLGRIIGSDSWQQTQVATAATLQQAIYGTQELNRLSGHGQRVNAVAHSPDAELLATASDDNTIKLWTKSGKLITTIEGHQDSVTDIVFSPQGDRPYLLASASADQSIILWEIADNKVKQLRKLNGHQDWITQIAFSPDGNTLASASRDGTIKLWQKNGVAIATLQGHRGWINSLSFSPDGKLMASADESGNVKLWQRDRQNVTEIRTFNAHQDRVTKVSFSSDSKYLATAGGDGMVNLWQLSNGTLINSYPHGEQIDSFSLSPNGKLLATATIDGKINLWHRDGILLQTLNGHTGGVLDVDFLPQTESNNIYQLVSTGVDKTVRIWQVKDNYASDRGGVYSVAASPTAANTFATAGWDSKIRVWRVNPDGTQQLVRTISGHDLPITQLQYSPDGKLVASASHDKTIKLWDAETGELISTLTRHQGGINAIAFATDTSVATGSYLLVSGSEDKTLKLWQIDPKNSELIKTLKGHRDSIKSVVFSPNGNLIASGSYDKSIKLWNLEGELINTLSGHNLVITDLKFSPDSKTLASSSWDNTVRLWQLNNNGKNVKLTHTLTDHKDGVTSLDFNSKGTILASASGDRAIKLWDLNNGELIKTLQGHSSQINSLAFSNDDKTVISAEEQQGLYWWNLELDTLLTKGCDRLSDYLQSNPNLSQRDRQICQ